MVYGPVRLLTRSDLEFDLSACRFIEVPVLLYLTSLLQTRLKRNLHTQIRLPLATHVLDFLQVWKFPQSFEDATGYKISEIATGDNSTYFDNPPPETTLAYSGTVLQSDIGPQRLLSKRFFGVTTFQRQLSLFTPSLAMTEASKWKNVATVLRGALAGPEHLLAPRIVYEALMNAIRHPGARLIQIVSHCQWPSQAASRGHLTISFWDDGKSIIETLLTVLKAGMSVAASTNVALRVKYAVADGSSEESIVTSDLLPTQNSTEDFILLSSTFPGVTSDPGRALEPRMPGADEDPELLRPGMGLYLLANAVIAVYSGELYLRTRKHRMVLKAAPDDSADYLASFKHYDRTPLFLGNLLTVRLPLWSPKEQT